MELPIPSSITFAQDYRTQTEASGRAPAHCLVGAPACPRINHHACPTHPTRRARSNLPTRGHPSVHVHASGCAELTHQLRNGAGCLAAQALARDA
eukprot:15474880-Alexandrium_andersonii.AAC.3